MISPPIDRDPKSSLPAGAIHRDISTRKNSPPRIRRGSAGGSQCGVVGTRAAPTIPAMAFGHNIASSTEEGSISIVALISWTYVARYMTEGRGLRQVCQKRSSSEGFSLVELLMVLV